MKKYNIEVNRPTSSYQTGYKTLEEFIEYFSYTLECGAAYQHEKGNKKIDRNPKTFKSLLKNLNNAVNNAALNGYSSTFYREAV